jgi:DNA repair exonuclease SbcCD ATPase subunit
MAMKIHVTLTLALVTAGGSIRGQSQNPENIKSLVSESVTICGNDDIWSDITSPKSVRGIKGIDWKGIDDTMKDYVGDHKGLVASSDTVITNLKQKIEEKKGKATSRDITKEEIESLVEQAVADDESFSSTEIAKATACGKPGLRFEGQRPNPEGFENSKEAMQEIAEGFFNAGVESDVKLFTRVCEDFLGFQRSSDTKADDLASYCDELCADLAQIVQTVSNNKGAGAKADVRKLERELAKQELKREELFAKQVQCEDGIAKIDKFHAYLEELMGVMSDKHTAFQKAEWELADASDALKLLTENLLAQQQAVAKAKAGLTDLGQAANTANDEMATADAQMQGASQALQTATDQWKELTADLEAVRAAEKYADEVKQRLSLLLMKMDGYVEECVREPVRNIGLSEETKVYEGEFFTWDVKTLPAKEDMDDALSAFHNYCETVAKGIFELVKDKVDLSPLCELQPQGDTLNEIVTTVQKRKDSVVDAIETVQSWLSPFKGTEVTKENEDPNYVAQGEPLGLRRVMGMQLETFYSGYLKKWKKHGEFLALLASITVAINDLDGKVTKAADEMDRVAKELEAANAQLEKAVAAFRQAEQDANLEKQQLTADMEDLENQVNEAKLNLEDLKKKVAAARLAWATSKTVLLTQHAAASAGLTEVQADIHRIE